MGKKVRLTQNNCYKQVAKRDSFSSILIQLTIESFIGFSIELQLKFK